MYICISPGPCAVFIRSPNTWSSVQSRASPQKHPVLLGLLKWLEKKCVDMECIQMQLEFPVAAGEWRRKLVAAPNIVLPASVG